MTNVVNAITLAKGTKIAFQYKGEKRTGTVDKEGFSSKSGSHLLLLQTEAGYRQFKVQDMMEVEVL